MTERQASGPKTAVDGRSVLIVSAAAFMIALIGSWLRPVWHDELYTLMLARLPVRELVSALIVDSGPPLHYLLCHGLFLLVGWQEGSALGTLMVRLPSVFAYGLIPWLVWRARSAGDRGSLWGPLLVVSWLPLLYFGTEARAYALLALVNALLWIRGPEWIERGGRGTAGFTVLAACMPLLHYTGFMSFLFLPALVFWLPRERRRTLILALVAAVLPALAWLPVTLGAPQASMGWLNTATGPGRPGPATVSVLAPAGPFPALFEVSSVPVPPSVSVLILGVLFCGAIAGALMLRRRSVVGDPDLRAAARLMIGLLPAAAVGLLALAGIPVYFAGRTESMVWTLLAALVALLILGLPAIARRAVAAAYVVIGAATIVMWLIDLPARSRAPGVEVGAALVSMVKEGDRVVVAGLWQLEVSHGLARGALETPTSAATAVDVETVPGSQARHPGWLDREAAVSPKILDEARLLEREGRRSGGRIWLVRSPALPLERTFFPAFTGWRRECVAGSQVIAVDLLTLPPAETLSGVPRESTR